MNKNYLILVCCMAIVHTELVISSWQAIGGPSDMVGVPNSAAGSAVAINSDGSIIAFGEPLALNNLDIMGRVLVYKYNTTWNPFGDFSQMAGSGGLTFAGYSVAISSDGLTVAFGEPGFSQNSGRVRVYRYNTTNSSWDPFGDTSAMVGVLSGAGSSVAISSDGLTVAMGQPNWQNNDGLVSVYRFDGTSWNLLGDPTATIGDGGKAGSSVAISSDGSTIAVGEPDWQNKQGRVCVYSFNGTSWNLVGGVCLEGQNSDDQAGYSVALNSDGQFVAVGEPGWQSSQGRVRVYKLFEGESWIFEGNTLNQGLNGDNAGDAAGSSVALSSDGLTVAVGEPGWDSLSGRVRVYNFNMINAVWNLLGNSSNIKGQIGYLAGKSLALSSGGRIVVVGEPGWNFAKGRVRAYSYSNSQAPLLSYQPQDLGGRVNAAGPREDFVNTIYRNGFGHIVYP